MKRISYLRPILIALVILSAVACSDNMVTPQPQGTVQTRKELNLVASKWYNQGSGYFVSEFGNIGGINASSQYTVYLLKNNIKTLISSGAIDYEGGKLGAETVQGNLSILYNNAGNNSAMPFTSLGSLELSVVY